MAAVITLDASCSGVLSPIRSELLDSVFLGVERALSFFSLAFLSSSS